VHVYDSVFVCSCAFLISARGRACAHAYVRIVSVHEVQV